MTLNQLKAKYTRLREEIESLGTSDRPSRARLARLTFELDQIDREIAAFKRLVLFAPVLRDVVPWSNPGRRRNGQERRASAR